MKTARAVARQVTGYFRLALRAGLAGALASGLWFLFADRLPSTHAGRPDLPALLGAMLIVLAPTLLLLAVRRHVKSQTATQAELRMLSAVVQEAPVGVMIADSEGRVEYVNPAFTVATGYSADDVLGRKSNVFDDPEDGTEAEDGLWATVRSGRPWRGTLCDRRKDGSILWEETVVVPMRDGSGEISRFAAIRQDITRQKVAESRLEFLAHYDALTGLPNRVLVQDRWRQAKSYADHAHHKVGLLFLDLDNFRTLKDVLGHHTGDTLLKTVANSLHQCLRHTDTVGRQGGDQFLIVLPDLPDGSAVEEVSLKILETIARPVELAGHELSLSLSIGAALYPDDGFDFDSLYEKANTAMHFAKQAGKNGFRFFSETMNDNAAEHLSIRAALRRALSREELLLHFQPQVDLQDGQVVGAEALIRWNHPELGMLPPAQFIPVAEESGLIVDIGAWVLGEACRQVAQWDRDGLPPLTVAVNLSALQLKRGNLLDTVTEALSASGLEPHRLELELTETVLLNDSANVLATMHDLKQLGVKLSIDDFGTGYSSLSYLRRLAVDKLKIDRSFVRDILQDSNDRAIVHAIVQMARSLGLRTIAEGVEDQEVLDCLRDHGCDEVQGYHIARPMPGVQLREFLALA